MPDIENVINGLEHCLARYIDGLCDGCSYMGKLDKSYMVPMKCKEIMMRDALALLKEQEARIRELEEELRALKYADQDTLKSAMMPAT